MIAGLMFAASVSLTSTAIMPDTSTVGTTWNKPYATVHPTTKQCREGMYGVVAIGANADANLVAGCRDIFLGENILAPRPIISDYVNIDNLLILHGSKARRFYRKYHWRIMHDLDLARHQFDTAKRKGK